MSNSNNNNKTARVPVKRLSEGAVFPSELILYCSKTTLLTAAWRDPVYGNLTDVPQDLMFTISRESGVWFKIAATPNISQRYFRVLGKLVGWSTEPPVKVIMHNESSKDIENKAGEQIARLNIVGKVTPELVDVTQSNNGFT